MPKPHLWIIAGPNGAGKTTLVRDGSFAAVLASCEFINVDELTLHYLKKQGFSTWKEAEASPAILKQTFIQAAEDSHEMLKQKIEDGACVGVESVLSTKKYCSLVERVIELGGRFQLVYVALHSPHLSAARVAQRKGEGGHDVPSNKLESRWKSSLEFLPWFASRANDFWILDNSEAAEGGMARLMLSGSRHSIKLHGIPIAPMRRVASEIVTQHSRISPQGEWRIEFNDTRPFR